MSGEHSQEAVAVALSGGVDSSVAAALLVQQGADVIGVTLVLWSDGDPASGPIARARHTAELLRIPFHLIDARAPFRALVVDYFVREYAEGKTPNPCVHCNRLVKFGLLLDQARGLGTARLATGHYARVRQVDGRWELLRGVDRNRDQSYFLHALDQSQLARCAFPVGALTKEPVRTLARELGLPAANAEESQDICFLAHGDYRPFLARAAPGVLRPGPILDTDGRVLGQHQGLASYTVGQRKGLGISASAPLYVVSILPAKNELVVGTKEALRRDGCRVEQMRYVSGSPPGTSFRAAAQVRYRSRPVAVTVEHASPGEAQVHFDAPQSAVAPGQFLVLYDDEMVLGGGVICERQQSVL